MADNEAIEKETLFGFTTPITLGIDADFSWFADHVDVNSTPVPVTSLCRNASVRVPWRWVVLTPRSGLRPKNPALVGQRRE